MKIEIEHEGSCLGATGGTGRLIVRDALAKGHSVVVLVRSECIEIARSLPQRELETRRHAGRDRYKTAEIDEGDE